MAKFKIGDEVRVVKQATRKMEVVHYANIGSIGIVRSVTDYNDGTNDNDYCIELSPGDIDPLMPFECNHQYITETCLELVS